MNDNTGNLLCVFCTGNARPTTGRRAAAPVETSAQAAQLSLNTAARLQMIPKGAEAALANMPERISEARWRVTWRVRNSPSARPHLVSVLLGEESGQLLAASNGEEMADFMAD
jgi:hypothetical protein